MASSNGGLLSLKWNNHQSTFLHVLSSLCLNETLSDVTLVCEGEFYAAHKIVLATCSEYFEKILEKIEGKHSVIVLGHVKCEELEALLSYMYEGEINVLQDKLSGLIEAAECLKIKGLSDSDDSPDLFSTRLSKRSRRASRHFLQGDAIQSPPNKKKRTESEESEHTGMESQQRLAQKINNPAESNTHNGNDLNEIDRIKQEVEIDLKNELLSIPSNSDKDQEYVSQLPYFANAKLDNRNSQCASGNNSNPPPCNSWDPNTQGTSFNNSSQNMNCSMSEVMEPVSRRNTVEYTTGHSSQLDYNYTPEGARDEGSFTCPYCPFATHQSLAYEAHIRRHGSDKSFACIYCAYTTSTKSNLKCHIRKHTGEKPFGCPHCDYRSAQSSNIKIHVRRMHKHLAASEGQNVPARSSSCSDVAN